MSLARDIAVMRKAGVLGCLDEEQLRLFAFGAEHVTARARDVLWQAGEPADGAALVLAGQMALALPSGEVLDRVASVGTLLDETALFVETAHRFTARAVVSTELLFLPRAGMRRILTEFPGAAERVHAALLARSERFVEDLAPVADRLAPR